MQIDVTQKGKHLESAHGAVNIVAGLFQLADLQVAFEHDPNAEGAHFHTIVGNRHRKIHVAYMILAKGELRCSIPNNFEELGVIALAREDDVSVKLFRLPTSVISRHGRRMGGYIELVAKLSGGTLKVKDSTVNAIQSIQGEFLS